MRKLLATLLLAAVPTAAVATATAGAAPRVATANVVTITAMKSGLRYDKKLVHARAGQVTLVFRNLSPLRHNIRLEVGEKEFGGTKTIGKGMTKIVVTLKKGTYHFYCSVPGHEDAGMSGHLIVA